MNANGPRTSERARIVLYEGPGSRPLADERRLELLRTLLDAGYSVTRAAPGGEVAPADAARHLVLAELGEGAAPLVADSDALAARDLRGVAAGDVVPLVESFQTQHGAPAPGGWKPWFPVIDYDRCTNCMQCLTFCLFDVYGVDEHQKIQVQHQDHCKTDCPACSRVCPEAAILFPKYSKSPINGAEVKEEDLKREAMKADISALLGGDLHAALRRRSTDARTRFSTERDESKALLERKRCLKKLGQAFDIPDEVLMTLPSVEAIEERARRAKEKAEKRRARSQTVRDEAKPAPTEEQWGI